MFNRGDELVWIPGPRDCKTFKDKAYSVVWYSGHPNIRGKSMVYVELLKAYKIILNTRLFKVAAEEQEWISK